MTYVLGFARGGRLAHALPVQQAPDFLLRAACGAKVHTFQAAPFTHLHGRACPECVRVVRLEGALP